MSVYIVQWCRNPHLARFDEQEAGCVILEVFAAEQSAMRYIEESPRVRKLIENHSGSACRIITRRVLGL